MVLKMYKHLTSVETWPHRVTSQRSSEQVDSKRLKFKKIAPASKMHTGILNFTMEGGRLSPGSVGTCSCTILFCPVKSKYSGCQNGGKMVICTSCDTNTICTECITLTLMMTTPIILHLNALPAFSKKINRVYMYAALYFNCHQLTCNPAVPFFRKYNDQTVLASSYHYTTCCHFHSFGRNERHAKLDHVLSPSTWAQGQYCPCRHGF